MVYTVPKSKASIKQNRFEFKLEGDATVYSIPLLKFLKPSIALELQAGNQAEAMRSLFTEYMPGVLEKLEDSVQMGDLFQAWQDASGVSLGESSASSSS